MNVARTLGDKAIEAQSYYSLGNAYILLQDYSVAIDFHLRHLQIAQSLEDKIGESRAFWSLGNAYAALGDLENAIMYANRYLNLAHFWRLHVWNDGQKEFVWLSEFIERLGIYIILKFFIF